MAESVLSQMRRHRRSASRVKAPPTRERVVTRSMSVLASSSHGKIRLLHGGIDDDRLVDWEREREPAEKMLIDDDGDVDVDVVVDIQPQRPIQVQQPRLEEPRRALPPLPPLQHLQPPPPPPPPPRLVRH